MNSYQLSVPGKVFLGGEYLALSGGATLLAGIEPRFQMVAREKKNDMGSAPDQKLINQMSINSKSTCQASANQISAEQELTNQVENPFHPESPAGKLWEKYKNYLQKFDIKFNDAFQGKGGFGGSSAEFLLLYAFLHKEMSMSPDAQTQIDVQSLLREYRELASTNGYTPSGADIVAQLRGGLTFFSKATGKIQNYPWLFSQIGFFVFKTPKKLKTHEHLSTLKNFDSTDLASAMEVVQESIEGHQQDSFIEGLNLFSTGLESLGFVCTETKEILEQLNHPAIVLKKGCGAMGADVVFVVYNNTDVQASAEIQELAKNTGLQLVATEKNLSPGLQIENI